MSESGSVKKSFSSDVKPPPPALEWLLPNEAGGDSGLLFWAASRDAQVDAPFEVTTATRQPLLGCARAVELEISDHGEAGKILGHVSVRFASDDGGAERCQVLPREPKLAALTESLAQIIEQEENYREGLRAIASALERIKFQRAARTSRAVVQ